LISFSGCQNIYYDSVFVKEFVSDSNGSLIIKLQKLRSSEEKCIKQDKEHKWYFVDLDQCSIKDKEYITYKENEVFVTDETNQLLFKDTLPTLQEVENEVNISLPNAHYKYMPLKSRVFNWDRKTNILVVGTDTKKDEFQEYHYSHIYYFSVIKNIDSYSVEKIYETDSISYDIGLKNDNLYINLESLYGVFDANGALDISSNKKLLCYLPFESKNNDTIDLREYKCIVAFDNNISVKNIFPELYPKEFIDNIANRGTLKYEKNYIFQDNYLHLFYMEDKAKGKYINYALFTKENPTTPLYEQKIVWEE